MTPAGAGMRRGRPGLGAGSVATLSSTAGNRSQPETRHLPLRLQHTGPTGQGPFSPAFPECAGQGGSLPQPWALPPTPKVGGSRQEGTGLHRRHSSHRHRPRAVGLSAAPSVFTLQKHRPDSWHPRPFQEGSTQRSAPSGSREPPHVPSASRTALSPLPTTIWFMSSLPPCPSLGFLSIPALFPQTLHFFL